MNTWLDQWDRRYTDRVRLLVEILPVLAQEPRFALKGAQPSTCSSTTCHGCRCMSMLRPVLRKMVK